MMKPPHTNCAPESPSNSLPAKAADFSSGERIVAGIVYGLVGLYFVLCCYFYRERVVFMDTSWQMVNLLEGKWVVMQSTRYFGAMLLGLPWLFHHLGMGVHAVIYGCSITNPILFLFVTALLIHWQRAPVAALAVIFLNVLHAQRLFFFACSEPILMCTMAVLLFVVVRNYQVESSRRSKWTHGAVATLTTLAIVFCHPLSLFVLPFIVAYDWAHKHRFTGASFALLFLIIACALWRFFWRTPYETALMKIEDPNIWNLAYGRILWAFLAKYFVAAGIVLVLGAGILVWRRQFLKLACLLGSTAMFMLVLNLTMNVAKHSDTYLLHVAAPVAFFGAVIFFCDLLPELVSRWSAAPLAGLVAGMSLGVALAVPTTVEAYRFVAERHFVENALLDTVAAQRTSVLMVQSTNLDRRLALYSWHVPHETLLHSALRGDVFNRTVAIKEIGLTPPLNAKEWKFFNPFPGENQVYALNRTSEVELLKEQGYRQNLAVSFGRVPTDIKSGSRFTLPVEIINLNKRELPSGNNPTHRLYVGYRWRDARSGVVALEKSSMPLGTDVAQRHVQLLDLDVPSIAGNYHLEVDLRSSSLNWLGTGSTVPATIR